MADELVIKHNGAFIVPERLRKLAFGEHDDRTDQERALRVALQDAMVLAGIYRQGRWTECTSEGVINKYVVVDRRAETILKLRAALKEALELISRLSKARNEACVLVHELLRDDVTDVRKVAIDSLAGEYRDVGRPGVDRFSTLEADELRKEFGL